MEKRKLYTQLIAFIFLAVFIAQAFSNNFIIANYYFNTSAYAKNCVNKARPMLHCNGKCQLMKKLQQQENKDKQNPERRLDNKNEVLLFNENSSFVLSNISTGETLFASINNNITKDIASDFFHPPGA